MATRKKAADPVAVEEITADAPVGRFYELQAELAPKRRAPYQLTADITIPFPTRRQVKAMVEAETESERTEILLGEHAAAVDELYDDLPVDEFVVFANDLRRHFFGQGSTELPGGSQGS